MRYLNKALLFLIVQMIFVYSESEFIATKDLKRGMKLTGNTRMSGNEMVSFQLEILSVMKNAQPSQDSILAEIKDDLFKETGVLAGMSGSPVYYEGQLVGAVAYTSSFLKKPIVGITPIHSMLDLIDYSTNNSKKPYLDSYSIYGLKSISTPLAVSGNLLLNQEIVGEIFGKDHLLMIPGGIDLTDKEGDQNGDQPFKPGDACGINLISGDLNISAIGTVTYVSNDFVLAFGHPMEMSGKIALPLHKAVIDAVVPKMTVSYKVGTLGKEVGSIVEDRASAVLGKMGKFATKIPVKVILDTPLHKKEFNYQIIDDANYFSSLASMVIVNSFVNFESLHEESTLSYALKIQTDYKDKAIEIEDVISLSKNMKSLMGVTDSIKNIFNYVTGNSFLPIKIKSFELHLKLKNSINYLIIQNVSIDKSSYIPGETVKINVFLQNYRGQEVHKEITLDLPKSMKSGKYPIAVSSGYYFLFVDSSFSPLRYIPRDPERLFEILNRKIDSRTLSVFMFAESQSMIVGGKEYASLPSHMVDMLSRSRGTDKQESYKFHYRDYAMDKTILGVEFVEIIVDEKKFSANEKEIENKK